MSEKSKETRNDEYMSRKISDLEFKVELLKREVFALRSVLSEFEGDKSEYTQMHAADAFARVRAVIL